MKFDIKLCKDNKNDQECHDMTMATGQPVDGVLSIEYSIGMIGTGLISS